ncbi:DMT family transporter [Evansella sp. AB-rgal1]|uniref:DMT family transporter n=1 Tax=Evansella sp. AB-rgal1 TaxID=3242696 RepID=UPI00359D611F
MKRELIIVHIAVLLFGLSGLFGILISLPPQIIVLGRVFFASLFLLFILMLMRKGVAIRTRKDVGLFLIIGGILALHWVSFFHSIQLSSVAVGLVTFATFPIFASFLEPILLKESFQRRSLLYAVFSFIGVLFIVPEITISNEITKGALWGLLSAFTFALLSIVNRKTIRHYSSVQIGFYQNLFAFLCLLPIGFFIHVHPSFHDILLMLLLGILFTGAAHVLFIQSLKTVNVRTASVIASLEPVYGIIAAIILFHEIPTLQELIGIMIILTVAIIASIRNN